MSKFVRLHEGKNEVFVNLDCVATIRKENKGAELIFATSARANNQNTTPLRILNVDESPDEIFKLPKL